MSTSLPESTIPKEAITYWKGHIRSPGDTPRRECTYIPGPILPRKTHPKGRVTIYRDHTPKNATQAGKATPQRRRDNPRERERETQAVGPRLDANGNSLCGSVSVQRRRWTSLEPPDGRLRKDSG